MLYNKAKEYFSNLLLTQEKPIVNPTSNKAEYYGMTIDQLTINTIRTLSMDGVQKANSGHPGTPMANAPLAYLLYAEIMRHNPHDPEWPDRDRFILSAGHASMLLYSILYLTGYDLSLEDLECFRQWGSKTLPPRTRRYARCGNYHRGGEKGRAPADAGDLLEPARVETWRRATW